MANAVEDGIGYPWALLKSDYVGAERISSYFAANGQEPPQVSLETTSIHSLFEILRNGRAIAHIHSQIAAMAHEKGLATINTAGTFWETTAGIAYRTSSTLSGPVQGFRQDSATCRIGLTAKACSSACPKQRLRSSLRRAGGGIRCLAKGAAPLKSAFQLEAALRWRRSGLSNDRKGLWKGAVAAEPIGACNRLPGFLAASLAGQDCPSPHDPSWLVVH